jgi:signal transduction histidine kinase
VPLLAAALAATRRPAMVIHSESYRDLGDDQKASLASVFFLHMNREQPFWAELVGIVGREILRRTQSESHARQLEQSLAAAEAEATLGRYMVEMRHSVNNALTSVLGNAELLALEPGLPATVQAQADTIRNMALRLNEIYRRFSSIEKELSVKARESSKPPQQARAAATGL